VVARISFLSACAFSVLLFAFVDPLVIVDAVNLAFIESANAGYAIGFFFLWAEAWVCGWLVLRLVRRKRNWPQRP
jgi:biotin transporter BioY